MKIVHIEDFFHPEAGYQLNILSKYMAYEGNEVVIVTSPMDVMPDYLTSFFGANIEGKDELFYKDTGVKIIRTPVYKYISGRSIYHKEIFEVVDSLYPDIVYVHGNDTLIGIQYILGYKKLEYPLILDSHMLQMASVNKFSKIFKILYKWFITPRIVKYGLKIIRTQDDLYVNKAYGIPIENCPWISTGSDTLLFQQNDEVKAQFRRETGINPNDFVMLYIGKLDKAKGGALLAQTIQKKFIRKNGGKVFFIIVGNTTGDYGKEVERLLSKSENRIIRYDTQPYTALAKYYQIGDAAVFPKQCSLSFYDAQAAGLPVIAENNNINIDRLSHQNGVVFKIDDVDDFRQKIEDMINMDKIEYAQMIKNAILYIKSEFDYAEITKRYLDIIKKEVEVYKK